jgi:glyoxylase-like metal-dependent hydrolase (beta-lactamase superfamily II)
MPAIPLEDSFTDIIGKAQRGCKFSDEDLARRADVSVPDLQRVKGGALDEILLRKIARSLNLGKQSLVDCAKKGWYPFPQEVPALQQFNTPFEDMTVNSYLASDAKTKESVAFDTGADCGPMLEFVRSQGLTIKLILLTHIHRDHIMELERLKKETGAAAWVCEVEPVKGAEKFAAGKVFQAGGLKIETRQTSGHAAGGITFLVSGLAKPIAVVGDAMFAGSMGGGLVSYNDALANNRKHILTLANDTVLCPGHGPLTTVGEEKLHNPFFPEFQKN